MHGRRVRKWRACMEIRTFVGGRKYGKVQLREARSRAYRRARRQARTSDPKKAGWESASYKRQRKARCRPRNHHLLPAVSPHQRARTNAVAVPARCCELVTNTARPEAFEEHSIKEYERVDSRGVKALRIARCVACCWVARRLRLAS